MTPGGDPRAIGLSEEDCGILALESATVVGHTCHVVLLEPDPVEADAVRNRIRVRLGLAPELRYRLGGSPECPVWVPVDDLDLSTHVLDRTDAPLDEARLRAFVARRFGEHLDRTRPLWAIDVVRLVNGGTALVWRIHHALADGTTVVRLAHTVLFDEDQATAGRPRPATAVPTAVIAQDHLRRRAHLIGFLRREFAAQPHRSPFTGVISTRRAVAFSDTSLTRLHAAARAGGGTVNDAVLAVVAGALRRWLEHHGAPRHDIRVRVPVSLHSGSTHALNRDSYFSLPLPLHLVDPLERLGAVRRATMARKEAHDAERMDLMIHELASVSPKLQRIVQALQASSREFAVSISNVAVSHEPVTILARSVTSIWPVAEIGLRHALRVCATSIGDTLTFGMCVDPDIIEDIDLLADGLEDEIALLVAATKI